MLEHNIKIVLCAPPALCRFFC